MRKNIFKIGEQVKVGLLIGKETYPFGIASPMLDLVGSIVTIETVSFNVYNPSRYNAPSLDGCKYTIKEDEHWNWNSGFFVPLDKPTIF